MKKEVINGIEFTLVENEPNARKVPIDSKLKKKLTKSFKAWVKRKK
jgi:hypothetical protein